MAKYFAKNGRNVTVVTTTKTASDGEFTEQVPDNVKVLELNWLSRAIKTPAPKKHVPRVPSAERNLTRRGKDFVMRLLGQLPDP